VTLFLVTFCRSSFMEDFLKPVSPISPLPGLNGPLVFLLPEELRHGSSHVGF
jgi:hypothetical protein